LNSNGFVLINGLYQPVYADPESIQILTFPNALDGPAEELVKQKILTILPRDFEWAQGSSITQFISGKRRYSCRAFLLEGHLNSIADAAKIALLLERGMIGAPAGSRKYQKFGGIYADPFGFAPDPKYFAYSRAHQEVIASLRNMVREGRGVGAVIGHAGTGKTLLLQMVSENLNREAVIAFFDGPFERRDEMIRAVMAAFGVDGIVDDPDENLHRFEKWLLGKKLEGRHVTLMCDDAQDYSFAKLESLFALADLGSGEQKLLQIILAGRQGLLEKLNSSRLAELGNRINRICRLSPLDDAEVYNYVAHRLRIAGCTRQIFTSSALAAIALYSRGIPLNVNMICRHALSLAASVNLPEIDERIVSDSAYDLVLKAQPTDIWDGSKTALEPKARRESDVLRRRHGMKLVPKS